MNPQSQQTSAPPSQNAARQFLKYTFFKLRPEWRRLPNAERDRGRSGFLEVLRNASQKTTVRTYNLVGTRGDADFLVWTISDNVEAVQDLVASIHATPLGGYVDTPHSFLAMTQKSQYLGTHQHPGQEEVRREPLGKRYLFVYPMSKKREWYGLPMEERRRIMGPHFQIGHKYPNIKIHTGYSYGLDDQEFVVAFEADDPGEFLDLVQELRPTEASKYTARETPIFTCVLTPPETLVKQWGP